MRRTSGLPPLQLLIWFSSSVEFGTMASMPSKPRTVVARRSTVVTVPDMPPTETMSPTRILRSKRMMTPLIRFLMMFCAPKPMPMASAPPRKANAVSGMRASLSTASSTTSSRIELIQRWITRASCGVSGTRWPTPRTSSRDSQPAAQ